MVVGVVVISGSGSILCTSLAAVLSVLLLVMVIDVCMNVVVITVVGGAVICMFVLLFIFCLGGDFYGGAVQSVGLEPNLSVGRRMGKAGMASCY